jgi:hypothetical protein
MIFGVADLVSILSNTMVNEFRVGYNYDHSDRQSTLRATEVASELGLEAPPSIGPDVPGFPSYSFVSGTNRPSNIADAARNTNRVVDQNSFSIADNLSWLKAALVRTGFLVTRSSAVDGFGRGPNHRGAIGSADRELPEPTGFAFSISSLGFTAAWTSTSARVAT